MRESPRQHRVILALGSNQRASSSMPHALRLLARHLTDMHSTPVLQTSPIGITSGPFDNCLVTGCTSLDAPTLTTILKRIEYQCGNRRYLRRQGAIVMDIDLLSFDQTRYHPDDWERPYILQLLSLIDTP